MADQYISPEKKIALEAEIDELKNTKFHAIAKRIDTARQMGDLAENAEYHQARDDLSWAKSRAKEIDYVLGHAIIVQSGGNSTSVVLGSTIVVETNGKERTYSIVGRQEADPVEGRISNESPLGQAFLGRAVGDSVDVTTPRGPMTYVVKSLN
jgi:transcription elongation factor GreA